MSIDKHVPDEEQVREAWRAFTRPNRDHGFGAWLARVRRDAARAVLNDLIEDAEIDMRLGVEGGDNMRVHSAEAVIDAVTIYLITEYPEEAP